MKKIKPQEKTCSRGHKYVRTKELSVCPQCYPGHYRKLKWDVSLRETVKKFPGSSGWTYVTVPEKYTEQLKKKRRAWGMFPITAYVGSTPWDTKLMIKKGGSFFVALKASVRDKEKIKVGDRVAVSFKLLLN